MWRFLHLSDVIEHHHGGYERRNRIHDGRVEFRILWRGAMRRLEYRHFVSDVAGRCEAPAADQSSESVGDHVAEQIRGNDHPVVLRILRQPYGLGIDVRRPQRDSWIAPGYSSGFVFHHARSFAQYVGFFADGHGFVSVLPRPLECGRQILRVAPRLMMRTEIASSGPGTAVNGLNLECDASAARTGSGGLVRSAPA